MNPVRSFQALSPARQVAVVAAAAALICVALASVYFLAVRKPYGVLFSNLRTMDAATIVAELDKKKVPYRLADQGATILAPRDLIDSARLDVMSQDLPLKGMVGFELFNKSDMGLTEFAQKINYQRALQGELARTIMGMDTVDTARVHLTLPEATVFRGDRRPPKASVTVTPRRGRSLPPATIAGIQRLVAAAVEDLAVTDVVVLDAQGAVVSVDPEPARAALVDDREAQLTARVQAAIGSLLPVDRFTVTVLTGEPDTGAPFVRRGVRVDVVIAGPDVAALQDDVRRLAEQAIGADPAAGDLVTVTVSAGPLAAVAAEPVFVAPPAPSAVPPSPTARPALAAASPGASWPSPLLWGGLLVALLAAAGFLHLRRPVAGRRLDPGQKQALAERFKALLDEGEPVASRRL